ncbi:MAG: helix-turn-helix transcriptional regulator [Cyanobacteria bacterium J06638_20]
MSGMEALTKLLHWHTIHELAEVVGVSPDTVNSWKQGHTKPQAYALRRIGLLAAEWPDVTWREVLRALVEKYRLRLIADYLGTNYQTVSTWKNKRADPQPSNRRRLLELAKEMECDF